MARRRQTPTPPKKEAMRVGLLTVVSGIGFVSALPLMWWDRNVCNLTAAILWGISLGWNVGLDATDYTYEAVPLSD